MRNTAFFFFSVLILLCIISCSSEGVVDDAFTVTVTFNGNGAKSGSMAPQRTGRGVETRLEANAYEWPCHNFTGWNSASDGSGTAYTDGQSIRSKENITLYAQWELDPIILTSDSTSWTDGNYYTLNSDVTMSWFVAVTGDVTLILADGYTLTAPKGIVVPEGNSLKIEGEGSGTLVSIGSGGQAGIGGGYDGNGGVITINGGTVNATGNGGGAGIGGGDEGNGGEITINGGTVTATGYEGGAGIGGGWQGNGGEITINNGTVTATGGDYGAGIGGGYDGNGGVITINGGTVNATGTDYGAGIGGGYLGNGGEITINSGTINATGGALSPPGIGRGYDGSSDGTLTLGEGVVMKVSFDDSYWDDYDGTNRRRYMKTVEPQP